MTEAFGKRPREPSDDGGRPVKREASSKMVEDFLESMDPSVRIKLRSMFDDGLLMYSDLDERNITELSKFDASVALEILEHYCSGDLTQVRNRRAYLAGAIKRRAHMTRDTYDPPAVAADGLPVLAPEVKRKFDQIKQTPGSKVGELDQRSLDTLAGMPFMRALSALDRFGNMDFASVRNPSALFMSIVRNVMEAEEPADWGPQTGGGCRGGAPYRDPYGPPAPPPPPPPPPPRWPPPAQFAAPAGLPPGMLITQGPGGGVVIAGGGVVGGLGLPAGLPALAGAGAATPGLMLAAAPGANGATQYMLVSTSAVQGAAGVLGGSVLAAPQVLGLRQQQPAPAPAPLQAAAVAAAPVPAGVPADWTVGRKHHGAEQGQLGVRVAEFHELSPFAVYVHPSPALKLQQLWDSGNDLVSMLDDKVWQVLAEAPAPEALAAIQEAADALDNPGSQIRNINAFFISVMRKVWPRGAASLGGSAPGIADFQPANRAGPGQGGFAGRGCGNWGSDGGAYGDAGRPYHSRDPAIHLLPPEQQLIAKAMCKTHAPLLREEHFDEGVIESLQRLSHAEGVQVLHELGHNSFAGVRNMPAYIMGIAKRYSTGQRGSGHREQPHGALLS